MHYVLSFDEIVKTRKFPLSRDGFRLRFQPVCLQAGGLEAEPEAARGEGRGEGE